MAKILWMSVAPWINSAYGQQSAHVCVLLKELGHDVSYFAFNHLGCVMPMTFQSSSGEDHTIRIYPRGVNGDGWGRDILELHAEREGADLVVSLIDTWMCPHPGKLGARDNRGQIRMDRLGTWADTGVNWVPWSPIDQDPLGEGHISSLTISETDEKIPYVLTMSDYGADQLRNEGFNVDVMRHGIDPQNFHPGDMAEARARLKWSDEHFYVTILADNVQRKAWMENLTGFREFQKNHPEARIYLHTNPGKPGGEPLYHFLRTLGIEDARAPSAYEMEIGLYKEDWMATILRASNVLLSCAYGEGACIPVTEANACGTPVVYGNYTATPELVRCGWPVDHIARRPSKPGGQMYMPHVPYIVDALEEAYEAWKTGGDEFERDRLAAAEEVRKEFSWDAFRPRWKATIEKALGEWGGFRERQALALAAASSAESGGGVEGEPGKSRVDAILNAVKRKGEEGETGA